MKHLPKFMTSLFIIGSCYAGGDFQINFGISASGWGHQVSQSNTFGMLSSKIGDGRDIHFGFKHRENFLLSDLTPEAQAYLDLIRVEIPEFADLSNEELIDELL